MLKLKENDKNGSESKQQTLLILTVSSVCFPFLITCVMLLVIVIYALCDKSARKMMFCDKSNLPLYLFGVLLIAVPLFYQRYLSMLAGFGFLMALIFFLYAKSVMTAALFHKIIDACCLSSVVCFLYALVQKLINGPAVRSTGGLLNANYYGTICEVIIILAVYRILSNKQYMKFYLPIIAINVAGIFLCDCQSAWLAMMVGVICLLLVGGHKKAGLILMGTSIVLVAVGVCIPGILPRLDRMPQTVSTRMNIWLTALKGIKAHPFFGQGTLTYLLIHQLYNGYKTYHAHSLYLDPLLSYGIVGTGLILTYAIITAKRIFTNFKQYVFRPINALVVGVIIAICVHGITDITILWVQTGMLVLFVITGAFIKQKD